jgi:hypothetical protein
LQDCSIGVQSASKGAPFQPARSVLPCEVNSVLLFRSGLQEDNDVREN